MSPAARRPLLRLAIRHPVLIVWCCYVLLIPVYVVPSGYPQPSDFLIVFLVPMAVAAWDGRLDRTSIRTLRPLLLFTLWVCVVSLAWALLLWSWGRNLLYPLYYLYDTAFFLAALLLYRRFGDPFLRLTVNLVLASVGLQVAAAAFFGGGARGHLFFHNPNQLGYYAMLAGCMIAVGQRKLGIRMLTASLGLAGCAVLAMLSASRAAVGGVGFLFMLLVFANPRVLIVAAIVAATLSVVERPVDDSVDTLEWRIEHPRMAQDTFWQQRGYDRIANNMQYVVLGAAEGNFWRFEDTTALGKAEIHSSAGTLLFCYGIPGVVLCILFLYQLVRGVRIQTAAMLMPVHRGHGKHSPRRTRRIRSTCGKQPKREEYFGCGCIPGRNELCKHEDFADLSPRLRRYPETCTWGCQARLLPPHKYLQVARQQGLASAVLEGCRPRQAPHNPALSPGF